MTFGKSISDSDLPGHPRFICMQIKRQASCNENVHGSRQSQRCICYSLCGQVQSSASQGRVFPYECSVNHAELRKKFKLEAAVIYTINVTNRIMIEDH